MCDDFPIYFNALILVESSGYIPKNIERACSLLDKINSKLNAEDSKYLSTVIDLVIRYYCHIEGIEELNCVESKTMIVYHTEVIPVKLQQILCCVIESCVEYV